MKSFKDFILGEAKDVIIKPAVNPVIDTEDDELEDISTELSDIISDMTDEEKEILLAHAYALVLLNDTEESEEDNELEEASIVHLTGAERTQGKMMRRMPKWKKKARVRYIKNKKCPVGTTWSVSEKSCTRINIDLSRLQKMISKMKIRQG
jgi:hypothetical protein